ncbi:hypothetical protein AVEN_212745-1 [Araneus ventricosus]|uniref:Uncharacterized protein n=1 Tax=Araneus ventricosus TaxID=182803 RepID=A0A4Y2H074_ARAVE|nr:hypothetical protein AVEN_212745-1 [Araneus ventricosus]
MKTTERAEFGVGIQSEIDPGVLTHVKIVQSTKAQNEEEKILNHIVLKIGAHVRERLLMNILKVPSPSPEGEGARVTMLDFILPFYSFS